MYIYISHDVRLLKIRDKTRNYHKFPPTGMVRLPCIVLTAASASAWLENLRNAHPVATRTHHNAIPSVATYATQRTQRTQRKTRRRFHPCVLTAASLASVRCVRAGVFFLRRLRHLRQKIHDGLASRALRWMATRFSLTVTVLHDVLCTLREAL